MKLISKLAVAAATVAVATAAVRRYDLLNKGAALFEQGVEKAAEGAEWLTAKAVEVTDDLLTRYDNFVNEAEAAADEPAPEVDDVFIDERGGTPTYGDVR